MQIDSFPERDYGGGWVGCFLSSLKIRLSRSNLKCEKYNVLCLSSLIPIALTGSFNLEVNCLFSMIIPSLLVMWWDGDCNMFSCWLVQVVPCVLPSVDAWPWWCSLFVISAQEIWQLLLLSMTMWYIKESHPNWSAFRCDKEYEKMIVCAKNLRTPIPRALRRTIRHLWMFWCE